MTKQSEKQQLQEVLTGYFAVSNDFKKIPDQAPIIKTKK